MIPSRTRSAQDQLYTILDPTQRHVPLCRRIVPVVRLERNHQAVLPTRWATATLYTRA